MAINDLIYKSRSYRRFYQDARVERSTLEQLVDLARIAASGQNLQPLKYFISSDSEQNEIIFNHLSWAAYLRDWDGPEEGERPAAYILILGDQGIGKSFAVDAGIAAQSIRLGVTELGLGSCLLGSIQREALAAALGLASRFSILFAIAIGKAKEHVALEPVGEGGSIKYWRDDNGVHHVPKRSLGEVLVN